MKTVRFKKIDAFATSASSGNPAAVVYLDSLDELSDAEKLRIAKELKGCVSEVGFVSPGAAADFDLCYFSSEREVAFCGHATIAIMNDIIADSALLRGRRTLTIATRTARLAVENRYDDERSVYISSPPAVHAEAVIAPSDAAAALHCRVDDIDATHPIRLINAGLETLIVPMTGLEAILRAAPDLRTLADFCTRTGADIVLLYSRETASAEALYRTRVFAATFGYVEDPATGSGNAAFGYYLHACGAWQGEAITIEQNGSRTAPNFVRLFSTGTTSDDLRVWFGGGAVVKISGHYTLT